MVLSLQSVELLGNHREDRRAVGDRKSSGLQERIAQHVQHIVQFYLGGRQLQSHRRVSVLVSQIQGENDSVLIESIDKE